MKLIILGCGGYGRTVADVAEQLNKYNEIIFLDDATDKPCSDYCKYKNCEIYPAFGNNKSRISWIIKLIEEGYSVPTIIHPSSYISPKAVIECGTVVLPHSIINTNTIVKRGCIINLNAIIDYGCVIEEGSHICIGAIVKAENRIPALTKIEAGEVIQNRQYLIEN